MRSETYVVLCHIWTAVFWLHPDDAGKWGSLGLVVLFAVLGVLCALGERREAHSGFRSQEKT